MKSIICKSLLLLTSLSAFFACVRIDAEKEMVEFIDVPRCFKPVGVKATVDAAKVTIDLKTFPEAALYTLELYDIELMQEGDPDPEHLIESYEFTPLEVPYKFETIEDMKIYYRIQARNDLAMKEPSIWTFGSFKTEVDPSKHCGAPEPVTSVIFNKVKFSWEKISGEKYVLEIYDRNIPDEGEPQGLVASKELQNDQMPYIHEFPAPEAGKKVKYYYRVKAVDLEGTRTDSKWVKGSVEVERFSWPKDVTAVDWDGIGYVNFSANRNFNIDGTDYTCDYKYLVGVYGNATKIPQTITFNKITYGKDCNFNSDKFTTGGKISTKTDILSISGLYIPQNQRHAFFTICKPGTLNVAFRKSSTEGSHATVALVMKKGGELSAKYLLDSDAVATSGKDERVFTITREDLEGIQEPAKIMFFDGANKAALIVYPLTWTTDTTVE